jgi:hypothetical protein
VGVGVEKKFYFKNWIILFEYIFESMEEPWRQYREIEKRKKTK